MFEEDLVDESYYDDTYGLGDYDYERGRGHCSHRTTFPPPTCSFM